MHKETLSKKEQRLFKAKTPKSYIDLSLKLSIPSGRKAFVTRRWCEKTGYTVDDIMFARNRHPYWKKKKMQGADVRNAMRVSEFNYSGGQNTQWTEANLKRFIAANTKDARGRYHCKDRDLAKKFKCSIPAIQHLRRKTNMALKIIEGEKGRVTAQRLLGYIRQSEDVLRNRLRRR